MTEPTEPTIALHADHLTVQAIIGRRPQTAIAPVGEGATLGPNEELAPDAEPLIQITALGLIPVIDAEHPEFAATEQSMIITPEAAYTLIVGLTGALEALAAYVPSPVALDVLARLASEEAPAPRFVDRKPQAWEDENAITYAWNTHDPELARKLHEDWLRTNGFDPFSEEFSATSGFWENAMQRWADPELAGPDIERWPAEAISTEPRDGWVPYLVKL